MINSSDSRSDDACSSVAVYPPQLAEQLILAWRDLTFAKAALPEKACLLPFLEVLYLTSFLHEESESVRCRLILAAPEDWHEDEGPPAGFHVLRFAEPRPFTPQEIRKLFPAASYHRALMGVFHQPEIGFYIWGIIESGARWVNRVEGGRFHGTPLPPNLVGHIRAPGRLLTACGYHRLVELEGGKILHNGFDPFKSVWLTNYFKPLRGWLMERMQETNLGGASVEEGFPKLLAQNVMRRTFSLIRGRGHGGMLIYLPVRFVEGESFDRWLSIRCPFQKTSATERFNVLVFRAMKRLATIGHQHGLETVSWQTYQELQEAALAEVDESFFEMAHLFADLMSVDGALVVSQKFDILGFGAEVVGESSIREVHRALDAEATATQIEPFDHAGTRHRAAYRLVSAIPDAVVAVISQDRSVCFVANMNGRVTYWPYLP